MKVIHTEECTTTPIHGTNYSSTEVDEERYSDTAVHCLKITARDFPEVFASGSVRSCHISHQTWGKKTVYMHQYATKY